jgi:DNA transposition AAA+ family ATPase
MSTSATKVRKQITSEIAALRKMEQALIKARTVIFENSDRLSAENHAQISDIFRKLGIGLEVTDAAVRERANALAQTYTK